MIKCNLAVIMAERALRMVDVIEGTKIAKATIRALYHNSGKGIQFETMNTLCEYLDISPGELFSHIRFNVEVLRRREITNKKHELDLKISLENEVIEDTIKVTIIPYRGRETYKFTAPHKTFSRLSVLSKRYVSYELFSTLYDSLEKDYENYNVEFEREEQ